MPEPMTLAAYLSRFCEGLAPHREEVAKTILALGAAGAEISRLVARGELAGAMAAAAGRNSDGDAQKALDLRTQELVEAALRGAGVAAIASEELDDWVALDPSSPIAVAFDPLDGSSNIDTNMSIGTIFSLVPALGRENPFEQKGSNQLAAGFIVYGPQSMLALTLGAGVDVFTLDPADRQFRLTREKVRIADRTSEFAINASNYRHWEAPVRIFIDDLRDGAEGPQAKDFNMRWIGSLVAEAFRILTRGGVFLYPGDRRKGYAEGRLRLLYEGHPIAFLIEQAGGRASNGHGRILDLAALSLHQRTPLFFGASRKIALIERLHNGPAGRAENSPLFGRRGLFRV